MYRFSRSIYREIAPKIAEGKDAEQRSAERHAVLEACEATMQRMAYDRRYFARPARTLFNEVRDHFALADQVHVCMVIERYVSLALEHLEQLPADVGLDGQPRHCLASTRKGTACQREPLPERDYCPSHKHLEELETLEGVAFDTDPPGATPRRHQRFCLPHPRSSVGGGTRRRLPRRSVGGGFAGGSPGRNPVGGAADVGSGDVARG